MKIKFKGKCIDNNKNSNKIVYGSLLINKDKCFIAESLEDDSFICNEIDRNTLSQFTGLYDDNGKEIYTGDIVEIHNTLETKTSYKSEVFLTYDGVLVNEHPVHISLGIGRIRLLSEFCNYGDGGLFDVKCKIVGNKFD